MAAATARQHGQTTDVVIAALLAVMAAALYGLLSNRHAFLYDEADYALAARAGVLANALEPNAIPISEFVARGMGQGRDKSAEGGLSRYIRSSGDLAIYRHFHVPLYFYYLAAGRPIVAPDYASDEPLRGAEHRFRWLSAACYVLLAPIVYFGVLQLATAHARLAAVTASVLVLVSPTSVVMAAFISPHALYVLLATAALLVIALALRHNDRRAWRIAAILVALAMLTIEYGALLLVTFLFCAWLAESKATPNDAAPPRRPRLPGWLKAMGAVALLMAVLWPAGVLKLGMVRSYAVYAYNAVVRGSEYYGTLTVAGLWRHRLTTSPVEYVLLVSGLAAFAYVYIRRRELRWLLPLGVYVVLYLLASAGNRNPNVQYVSSLLPPGFILAAMTLTHLLGPNCGWAARALATLVIVWAVGTSLLTHVLPTWRDRAPIPADLVVHAVARADPPVRRLLCEARWVPLLTYYFPHAAVVRTDARGDELLRDVRRERADAAILETDGVMVAAASKVVDISAGDPGRPRTVLLRFPQTD